jgi:hypothetical protein
MEKVYNLYIDESCHLEHDKTSVMCIGYVKIEKSNYSRIKDELKAIKLKYNSPTELKWNKLSHSRLPLYKALVDYFFQNPVFFRCVLVKNKSNLDHETFNRGDHNAFYYKMVYQLLHNPWVNRDFDLFHVFLDIKDTRGKERLQELDKYLQYKYRDVSPFTYLQHIRSHESELIQLTDLFIGAATYKARGEMKLESASKVKVELIEYIEKKAGYMLDEGTEPWAEKFNIFDFQISSSRS